MAELSVIKGPGGRFFVSDGEKNVTKGFATEDEAKAARDAMLAAIPNGPDPAEGADPGGDAGSVSPDAEEHDAPQPSPLAAVEDEISGLDAEIERLRKIRDDKQAERDRIVVETGASENTPFPTLLQEFFAAQDRERMARVESVEAAKAALGMASGAGVSPLDQARAAPKRPAPRIPASVKS